MALFINEYKLNLKNKLKSRMLEQCQALFVRMLALCLHPDQVWKGMHGLAMLVARPWLLLLGINTFPEPESLLCLPGVHSLA